MRRIKYDFAAEIVPSVADMITRIGADAEFPEDRRLHALWALRCLCRWTGQDTGAMPFAARHVQDLLSNVSPGAVGVSLKTIQNARSAIAYLLRHYQMGRTKLELSPFTPELDVWRAVFDKYQKASLDRFFRFLSARQRRLSEVTDADADAFRMALEREQQSAKALRAQRAMINAWNKLCDGDPEWPGQPLACPLASKAWALPWSEFSKSLRDEVETFFDIPDRVGDIFSPTNKRTKLKPSTIAHRKQHLRLAASILCRDCGVEPESIVSLADVCRPGRFKAIIAAFVDRHDGKVTLYVEQIAISLLQVGRESGALTEGEINEVLNLKRLLSKRGKDDRKADINRDQAILDQLDSPERMDALLTLPSRVLERVCRRKNIDRRGAIDAQLATGLEVWFAAPLRITNFATLRLDEHLHRVKVGRKTRVIIRVPGEMTKNGKPLEHYLHDDAAAALELYLKDFRPLLQKGASPWLFPGRNGDHKHPQVLARQMSKFIWDGAGVPFHPHLIRKIVTKIILDQDPSRVEIARLQLGHTDSRATRAAYVQAQVRAAQSEYLKALQQRRLGAFRSLESTRGRTGKPQALRVGKGTNVERGKQS